MTENSRRFYFIVNPYSSKGHNAGSQLRDLLNKHPLDYELLESSDLYNIKDIVYKIQGDLQKKDILVAVGGDGTLSEVVQVLNELGLENPVGLIPTGSGNDFARFHHIPRDLKKAFLHLFEIDHPSAHDIIVSESDKVKYVINSIGCGTDGRVIHNLHQERGFEKLGAMAYLRSTLLSLFRQKPFKADLEVDGKKLTVYNSVILAFMNQGYLGGGIFLHPQTISDDGYFDVIFSHNLKVRELVPLVYKVLTDGSHLDHPKVHTIRAKKVTARVHSNEFWQADGEDLGNHIQEYSISTIKQNYWI